MKPTPPHRTLATQGARCSNNSLSILSIFAKQRTYLITLPGRSSAPGGLISLFSHKVHSFSRPPATSGKAHRPATTNSLGSVVRIFGPRAKPPVGGWSSRCCSRMGIVVYVRSRLVRADVSGGDYVAKVRENCLITLPVPRRLERGSAAFSKMGGVNRRGLRKSTAVIFRGLRFAVWHRREARTFGPAGHRPDQCASGYHAGRQDAVCRGFSG